MSNGAQALKRLGLARNATQADVKQAFRKLAKKWHPDHHQGSSKAAAEETFKEVQAAYALLSAPGGLRAAMMADQAGGRGPSSAGSSRYAAGRGAPGSRQEQEWWGDESRYGAASRPGYDPYGGRGGYMGFGGAKGQSHWYEDTAAAAKAEDNARAWRSYISVAIFGGLLLMVSYTGSRDKAAKERGDLVDAWWNPNHRRWERPPSHMFKDPMLSALIHLKPPSMVYSPSTVKVAPRKQALTIDGSRAGDSYRAREQGHRS